MKMNKMVLFTILSIFTILSSVACVTAVLLPAPYVYYKLDETSGVIANDQMNVANMTNLSTSHWTTLGKINGGYNVSFERGFMQGNLTSSPNWTFTFWVNRTGDVGDVGDIILGTGSSGDGVNNARFYISTSRSGGTPNRIELNTYASAGNTGFASNNNLTQGQYYFVAVVLSQTNLSIWINGSLDNMQPRSAYDALSGDNLSFFGLPSANGLRNVTIDEIGIFNRILTPAEISTLYNAGAGQSFPFPTFAENSQTYITPVVTGTTNPFTINITYDSSVYTGISSTLYYNNTGYLGMPSGSGNNLVFTASAIAPPVVSTRNISFYWDTQLTNSSGVFHFNSSRLNQTVTNISIDDCSVNTVVLYNFTLRDEDTQLKLNPTVANTSFQIDISLSTYGTTNEFFHYHNNFTAINPIKICISTDLNNSIYRSDIVASYVANNYVNEFYYVDNNTVSNTTLWQNISLYDLLTTQSTSFLFSFQDITGVARPNLVVNLLRKYIADGVFREVERGKQDNNGQAILHLVEEDVIYKFNVTLNGVQIFLSDEYTAKCLQSPCSITLTSSGTDEQFTQPSGYFNLPQGTYNVVTNKTSRNVTLFFNLNQTALMNLSVYAYNGSEILIAMGSLNASFGAINVHVPFTYGNFTFFAVVWHNNNFVSSQWVDLTEDPLAYFGLGGLFLSFLIILTITLMGVSQGEFILLWFFVGVVVVVMLGIFSLGWVALMGLVSLLAMLLIKLAKRRRLA